MVLVGNPPTRKHWLFKWFGQEPLAPGYRLHRWSTLDNLENLAPDYVEGLMAWEKTDNARFRRFVLGEWGYTTDEQPVLSEFDEEQNTGILEPVRDGTLFLLTGWDLGFRVPAIVWAQILSNGWVNLLRELIGDCEQLRPFARRFKQQHELYFPNWAVVHYCDPAGVARKDDGMSSVRVLRSEGIRPRYRKLPVLKRLDLFRDLIRDTRLRRRVLQADRRHCKMFIEGALGDLNGVRAEPFNTLVVDFARRVGAKAIVKGLRAISDFEYEFEMNQLNRRQDPEIESVYLMASPQYSFLSSSGVKELATFGGRIDDLVRDEVARRLQEELKR